MSFTASCDFDFVFEIKNACNPRADYRHSNVNRQAYGVIPPIIVMRPSVEGVIIPRCELMYSITT